MPRSLNTQHMPPLQRSLWKDFGKQILVSLGIFSTLFLILYIVEWLVPSLQGTLLQWHDPAFVVGIPASAIGVGYVLTIRNPKNYTGFYGGILLNLLLYCISQICKTNSKNTQTMQEKRTLQIQKCR